MACTAFSLVELLSKQAVEGLYLSGKVVLHTYGIVVKCHERRMIEVGMLP